MLSNDKPAPASRGTILIVDDIADNRDILMRRLSRRNFRCFEAKDGYEALERLKQYELSLVLLDVTMPGLSGIDVLKHIRSHFDQRQLPVIMVTADAQIDSISNAKSLGANDYITKPIDFGAAVASIETHIDLARASIQIDRARQDLRLALRGVSSASAH